MDNILVTGGAGYIGSHACLRLCEEGFNPVTFDNLSTGWRDAVQFGPFEHGDLLNKDDLSRVFRKYNPVAVMHFAALSDVGRSVKHPDQYWRNNFIGSLNLMDVANEHNCLNFVFSSTCATYGDQDCIVLDENSSQAPINAYGASKLAIEFMLRDYQRAFGLKHVIFRYFNVAGADKKARIGEFHNPETHLIPLILDVLAGKRAELTIYGTDYDTVDGTCIRDYVHVCDLVDAHILGLKWLLREKESRVFNLGTGKGFSVREVLDQAKVVTNRVVPIVEGDRREGDCAKLVSGSVRAVEELGWNFDRSNMYEMMSDAWRWHKGAHYKK